MGRTARQIGLSGRAVVFESLKKRWRGVFRAVPVQPKPLDTLDMVHGIREAQRRGGCSPRCRRVEKAWGHWLDGRQLIARSEISRGGDWGWNGRSGWR
jgi:endogenous inhibitor of DNA gyrase (YacG/DUF329 family)